MMVSWRPGEVSSSSIRIGRRRSVASPSPLAGKIPCRLACKCKFTNRDHRTLPVKFASLLDALSIGEPFYLVADAAFACRSLARPLVDSGHHLISRLPRSAVAYEPVPPCNGPRRRGRPRL